MMLLFKNLDFHRENTMNIKKVVVFGLMAVAMAVTSVADMAITDITAKQRYPWNGLVDLKFNIIGSNTCYTSFFAKDVAGWTNIPMKAIAKLDGSLIGEREILKEGTYNWVWDAAKDLMHESVSYEQFLSKSSTVVITDKLLSEALNFDAVFGGKSISKTEGSVNAKGYNIKVDGSGKSIQFQVKNGGYLKCVCVYLEQSGDDIIGFIKWARYMPETFPLGIDFESAPYTDYDISTSDDMSGYGIKKLTLDYYKPIEVERYEQLKVVGIVDDEMHKKVQLWEGGPYWATTNIGAEKPEEYGYYFWWGDTVGYKRENNKWVASDGSSTNHYFGTENAPTYYKTIKTLLSEGWIISKDGTYVLAPEHDAAQVQWGGGWRMPTYQEFRDLKDNCVWTWTTMSGVYGYVVSGKGDYDSNSIFLPCAGYGRGTSQIDSSSYGKYWSSVPYSDSYNAFESYFHSSYISAVNGNARNIGRSVRPVQGFTK